jgi:hypothetical protein
LRTDLSDRTTQASDQIAMWRCLDRLDWSSVDPADLAVWLCAVQPPLLQASVVVGSVLHARTPEAALNYLADYKPECIEVRESGLQIMALEAIELVDPAWVAALGDSMTPDALFTGSSSEQGILAAEYFIRRGNAKVTAILESGGRGEYGGSEKEISRAAATSLFLTSTSQWDANRGDNAWSYGESLIYSPTTPPIIGGVLAAFLTSTQTWPNGDSTPALTTLLIALDDPRFTQRAASTLFSSHPPEGPKGCNRVLWDKIYAKVLAVAEENGWKRQDSVK